jgi:hypothetical protein
MTVECVAWLKSSRGQFRFAVEAKQSVPMGEGFLLAKSHRGLHVIGLLEADVTRPVTLLRSRYGTGLTIDRGRAGEPVVQMRAGLQLRYIESVRAALARRNISASVEFVGAHYCVLGFDAPARRLLGLPGELDRLSCNTATHQLIATGHVHPSGTRGGGRTSNPAATERRRAM